MTNSLNLQEIDQEQAINLARFFIKSKQNCAFFGRRGVGKTEIAIQAAKDCNYKINYINLSVIERPDLAGYPNLLSDSDIVTFKSPYFLPTLKEGQKPDAVILFDEVDKAPSEVTAPLLELLRSRTINGKPVNVAACLLTGNLFNEGAHSNMVSSALLDRTAKYVLQFSFDKWMDWCKVNGIHDLILGFLSKESNFACGDIESTSYATPSPRGWSMVSDCLYKARQFNMHDTETIVSIVAGFVGLEAASNFRLWFQYFKEFEPKILSLIETGEYPKDIDKFSVSELFIFCVTLCYITKQKITASKIKLRNLKYIETVCDFYSRFDIEDEVQLVTIRNSFPVEFITKHRLYESQIFLEKSKELQTEILSK